MSAFAAERVVHDYVEAVAIRSATGLIHSRLRNVLRGVDREQGTVLCALRIGDVSMPRLLLCIKAP